MKIETIKDHLSYSSVNKYLQCPKRWHYDYVIAPGKMIKSLALGLGSVYHKALEILYTTGDMEVGRKMLVDFASENGRFAQKEIKAISTCFENYCREIYPQYQSRVEKVELIGRVDIAGVSVPLEYRMDLVTTDGVIVDHKTVGRMKPEIEYSFQFDLYAYAYYKVYRVFPKRVEYHNAYKSNGGVEVVGKSPRISDTFKAIECVSGALKGIENDIFMPKYGKQCNFCPHKEICDRQFGSI